MFAVQSINSKVILDIGCGLRPIKGCLHLDCRALPHVEVVHDLNKPLPFPDGSFEGVYAFDVLEHVDEPLALLEEIWRVLRPKGFLELRTSHYLNPFAWKDMTHKHHFACGSFDMFDKRSRTGKKFGFYTSANFRIVSRRWAPGLDLSLRLVKI